MIAGAPDLKTLTGPQKAAIFLLMMGEAFTSKVFKTLDQDDIRSLAAYMSTIQYVPQDVLVKVMNDFLKGVGTPQMVVQGKAFLKSLVDSGLDEDRAKAIYNEIRKGRKNAPFSYLEEMDAEVLAGMIQGEHPQTIALIIVHLRAQVAGDILKKLPKDVQSAVARRVAEIGKVPVEVVHEIDDALQISLMERGGSKGNKDLGGAASIASILNEVDRETEESVLSTIEEEKPELAEEIRQHMFLFEDLVRLDDRGMREILKGVETAQLGLALKTASEELTGKMLGNLSSRAAEMLKEDMDAMGPVRLADVEAAQQAVIRVARSLEAEGKIRLGKGKEEILV